MTPKMIGKKDVQNSIPLQLNTLVIGTYMDVTGATLWHN